MAERYPARRGDVIDTTLANETSVPARVIEVAVTGEAAA
jgi:hypothetical protein